MLLSNVSYSFIHFNLRITWFSALKNTRAAFTGKEVLNTVTNLREFYVVVSGSCVAERFRLVCKKIWNRRCFSQNT